MKKQTIKKLENEVKKGKISIEKAIEKIWENDELCALLPVIKEECPVRQNSRGQYVIHDNYRSNGDIIDPIEIRNSFFRKYLINEEGEKCVVIEHSDYIRYYKENFELVVLTQTFTEKELFD